MEPHRVLSDRVIKPIRQRARYRRFRDPADRPPLAAVRTDCSWTLFSGRHPQSSSGQSSSELVRSG